VAPGEVFQALVIGGSVYKSALMTKDEQGNISVIKTDEEEQPTFDTDKTFLSFIAEKVDPTVSHVGLNFAYALTPIFEKGRLDGLMVGGNMKGNAFAGLENKPISTTVEEHLLAVRGQKVTVAAANDTICLLLSGLTQYPWDKVAAGIVGTGMNFALFTDKNTSVNLESAHFNKFTLSQEAAIIDKHSMNPGFAWAEKEVAGAYLHLLFNEGMKLRGIVQEPLTTTEQIDEIAEHGSGEAKKLATQLLDRATGLVSAQIVGITQFLDRDTAFVMEGSLFWKGYRFRERVEQKVRKMLPHRNISYIHIPDSGIFGAAKLIS
jgi:hexokinase